MDVVNTNTIPTAVASSDDGNEFLPVVAVNRSNFKPKDLHKSWREVPGGKSRSVVYKFGIHLVDGNNKRTKGVFYCLLSGCFEKLTSISLPHHSSSNVAQHLSTMHGIISERSKKLQMKRESNSSLQIRKKAMNSGDHDRHFCLHAAVLAAKGVSFNLLCGSDFENLFEHMSPQVPSLYYAKLKSSLLDLYLYVKSQISEKIKQAAEHCKVPFLHITADMYKNTLINYKFFGVRVSYIDFEAKDVKSFLLAVRVFNPSFASRTKNRSSDLMSQMTNNVLDKMDIDSSEILTATSDAGSDVKRLMKKCLEKPTEWCLAHLLNCALVEAFGSNQNTKKCKNEEARLVSLAIRKVLEHVNKSDKATQWIREAQIEENGQTEKLANFAYQRWTSAYFVYKKVLKNFHHLHAYFIENQGGARWPDNLTKKVIEEFYSILNCAMTTMMQVQSANDTCLIGVASIQRIYVLLRPQASLQIYDLEGKVSESRAYSSLDPVSQSVLVTFRKALNERFFDRYHPVKAVDTAVVNARAYRFPYVFDLCQLLVPGLRNNNMLKYMIDERCHDEDFTAAQLEKHALDIRRRAFNMLVDAAVCKTSILFESELCEGSKSAKHQSPAAKRPQKLEPSSNPYMFFAQKNKYMSNSSPQPRSKKRKANNGAAVSSEECEDPQEVVAKKLLKEIDVYLSRNESLNQVEATGVLDFWLRELEDTKYPLLAHQALGMLGAMSSSAALERDFGAASDLITHKRACLKPWMVEVLMMVRLNTDLLPQDITAVPSRSSEHDDVVKSLSKCLDPVLNLLAISEQVEDAVDDEA